MSPRNERYQTPPHIAQGIRSRRKHLLNGPFSCPSCGKDKLMIQVDRKNKKSRVFCVCGIDKEVRFAPIFEAVDYYSKFVDCYNQNKRF
ncbi:hypothetical protein KY312_02375 [Candidatus Woesearchaeota archaeon]|nr:hypothetical protein [Candidatus Woesearchaeota archaeon]